MENIRTISETRRNDVIRGNLYLDRLKIVEVGNRDETMNGTKDVANGKVLVVAKRLSKDARSLRMDFIIICL